MPDKCFDPWAQKFCTEKTVVFLCSLQHCSQWANMQTTVCPRIEVRVKKGAGSAHLGSWLSNDKAWRAAG